MVITVLVVLIVAFVITVFVWGRLGSGGPDDDQLVELDPRTSRRQMDKQFKKPPNDGGLL